MKNSTFPPKRAANERSALEGSGTSAHEDIVTYGSACSMNSAILHLPVYCSNGGSFGIVRNPLGAGMVVKQWTTCNNGVCEWGHQPDITPISTISNNADWSSVARSASVSVLIGSANHTGSVVSLEHSPALGETGTLEVNFQLCSATPRQRWLAMADGSVRLMGGSSSDAMRRQASSPRCLTSLAAPRLGGLATSPCTVALSHQSWKFVTNATDPETQ